MLKAVIAAVLLSTFAAAADRPSAEQVAEAVQASREAYVARDPPPTQEEFIAGLREDMLSAAAERRTKLKKARTRPEIREISKEYNETIANLRRQITAAQKAYTPAEVEPQLMPLEWSKLEIGTVGRCGKHYGRKAYGVQTVYGGAIHCVQILDEGRILAEYTLHSPYTGDMTYGPYIVQKIDTSAVQEGHAVRGDDGVEFDLVVTGRETYEDTLGASHTVFVLEVFDPDQPFE